MILNIRKILFIYRLGLKRTTYRNLLLVIRYLLNKNIFRKNLPGALILGVTYRCQCNCSYCSIGRYPILPNSELTTEEIKTIIAESVVLGIPKINFFGGEPLIRNDLLELISYAAQKGIFVFLDTNGYLLERKTAFLLKKAGISAIAVNINSRLKSDTVVPEESAENMFIRIAPLIGYCREERIPCVISVYVNKNILKSEELLRIINLSKRNRAAGVRLLLPMRCGKLLEDNDFFSETELQKVYGLIDNYFVYQESILYGIENKRRICEARLKNTIYISPYGDVQFCYTIPFSFGNLRSRRLTDIMQSLYAHELFEVAPKNECPMNDSVFRKKSEEFKLKNENKNLKYLYS